MNKANRQYEGFTLMEATIALAVFAIGMLSFGGAFSQIIAANATSRHKQTCALLAERQMSRLRMASAGEIDQTNGTCESPFSDYAWDAEITCRSGDSELMNVWITVKHRSGVQVRLWSQMVMADDQ